MRHCPHRTVHDRAGEKYATTGDVSHWFLYGAPILEGLGEYQRGSLIPRYHRPTPMGSGQGVSAPPDQRIYDRYGLIGCVHWIPEITPPNAVVMPMAMTTERAEDLTKIQSWVSSYGAGGLTLDSRTHKNALNGERR